MSGPDPTRLVADADVLACDLLVGGAAREALDHARRHSWVGLVASDELLADGHALVTELASDELADDWLARIEDERIRVEHPPGDHPALASAYRGEAAHLLTFDDELASPGANVSLQSHLRVSVRSPDAFARLFDAASLYESRFDGSYPGPDRDPRA